MIDTSNLTPTLIEQKKYMYSVADSSIIYWSDWAKRFIECCKRLGWEVVAGPGTSLGPIMMGLTATTFYYFQATKGAAWDCDWTQENGICLEEAGDYTEPNVTIERAEGWFDELWEYPYPENGIDEKVGRFDFVVYVGENSNNEKIGFRIKYPICSVGYKAGINNGSLENYIWGSPGISLYGEPDNFETCNSYALYGGYYGRSYINISEAGERNIVHSHFFNSLYPGKGYVRFFGKIGSVNPYATDNYIYWARSDESNRALNSGEALKWSKDLQRNEEFTRSVGKRFTSEINRNRMFQNGYWKSFNIFNYLVSENKDTIYMYVSNSNQEVAFKLLVTTLDNGEKSIIIERQDTIDNNTLCEMSGVTNTTYNVYGEDVTNSLIRLPIRPYCKISSGIDRFSLSRMLIPTQKAFCKDLYYVIKRDNTETIGNGQYIIIKDKENNNHYFKVIPFGSRYTYEIAGDNTTYLAIPVVGEESE